MQQYTTIFGKGKSALSILAGNFVKEITVKPSSTTLSQLIIMKKLLTTVMLLGAVTGSAYAQHYDMNRWGDNRGYTAAPYSRYEAEPGMCETNGSFLGQTDDQMYVQSEASNQQAVSLNNGQSVWWTNDTGAANGVTLRFSLPYGQSGTVGIYVNGQELGRMSVNTDHSWEWNSIHKGSRTNKPEYYSTHGSRKEWARMRFDEEMCLLSRDIQQGERFELRNLSGATVTVDFVEIEKARHITEQDARNYGWTVWDKSTPLNQLGGDIYIGEGTWSNGFWGADKTIHGAGIFYTRIIGKPEAMPRVTDVRFSNTQNQRYPNAGDSEGPNGYQDIKCFTSYVYAENCLIEHFTCGAWFNGTNGCTFRHCRIRNNYADGVNFCNGSSNGVVEHCNFRNNGDDDIASWSNGGWSTGHRVENVTCEHNWRASSLGWFGGGNHTVKNMLIKDGMENGIRCVTDFGGSGFDGNQPMRYENIAIVHQACTNGTPGRDGDFWGVDEAALHIEASNNGNVERQIFSNIDIYDSRGDAVFIGGRDDKRINNIEFDGVRVHGVRGKSYTDQAHKNYYAFYFENARGNATLKNIEVTGAEVTNFINPDLSSGQMNGFSLTCDGVSNSKADIPAGVKLHLTGLAYSKSVNTFAADNEIMAGEQVKFSVRIDNSSSVSLPADCVVTPRLTIDDGTTLSFPRIDTGIAPGESKIVSVNWTATAGGRTVVAELDPQNRLGDAVGTATITKKFNVTESHYLDLPFTPVGGKDLQALDLRWKLEGQPDSEIGHGPINAGDHVIFSAVIVNAGSEYIDGGQKIGVKYIVDGQDWDQNYITWNDNIATLASHETKLFTVTGGGGQNRPDRAYWLAENGTHRIRVYMDDTNHIDGENRSNNQPEFNLTIPYGGLVYHPQSEVTLPDDLEGITNAIGNVSADNDLSADTAWYTLTGIRLDSRPLSPGIYIHNGKKMLVR